MADFHGINWQVSSLKEVFVIIYFVVMVSCNVYWMLSSTWNRENMRFLLNVQTSSYYISEWDIFVFLGRLMELRQPENARCIHSGYRPSHPWLNTISNYLSINAWFDYDSHEGVIQYHVCHICSIQLHYIESLFIINSHCISFFNDYGLYSMVGDIWNQISELPNN